jgi:predicted Rossmann-fold nucleotide-binding protein
MRGPVSPDGSLAAHPEGNGQAALFFKYDDLRDEGFDRVLAGDPSLVAIGRSVLGQLGVDIQVTGPAVKNGTRQHGVWVPIGMQAYTPVGNKLVEHAHDLVSETSEGRPVTWQGRSLDFGRFANYKRLEKMDAAEVQADIDDCMILLEPYKPEAKRDTPRYRLNDDGSLAIKLSPVEFTLNQPYLIGTKDAPAPRERLLGLLHQGRTGIDQISDPKFHDPNDRLPSYLLGGVSFSPGVRYWNVRSQVADNVFQLASASLFDGNRLMGIGRHLRPYERHRQVELVSTGDERQRFDDTWITIDLFRSKEVGGGSQAGTNWLTMSPEARHARHIRGVTALEALEAADPASRNTLQTAAKMPGVAALVLSRSGAAVVPESGSLVHDAKNITEELKKRAHGIPARLDELLGTEDRDNLQKLIENLRAAGDRTSTVIAPELSIGSLANIVSEGGARAILAEKYIGDNGALTDEELGILTRLSRQGVGLAKTEGGEYREFHPIGLWVKPGVAKRLEKVELGIAIFGARRPWLGDDFDAQLHSFMKGLITDLGPDKVAIIHGNGTGIMEKACQNARKLGILSLGTGIDAERNGQGQPSNAADGVINMDSLYWIIRQHQLDTHTTVPVILPGGFGTLAEIYNALTSRKLLLRNPGPMYVVAPDGDFEPTRLQIDQISDQRGDPDSPRFWIKNTVHFVDDLATVGRDLTIYRKNMPAYWEKAGISPQHIADSYAMRIEVLSKVGLDVPQDEKAAVETYAGHLLD